MESVVRTKNAFHILLVQVLTLCLRMFSFSMCRSFVADIVDFFVFVVAVFGLCENFTMIVSLVSCIPTGVFEQIPLSKLSHAYRRRLPGLCTSVLSDSNNDLCKG